MSEFKVGDWVYAHDWCYGQIVDLTDDEATVAFETIGGGGNFTFDITDLKKAPAPKPNRYERATSRMKYHISESGSTGRYFDSWEDFVEALEQLADTYAEHGEECFEVEVVNG